MRLHILGGGGIPAKLARLAVFITLAMAFNLWIASSNFARLSAAMSVEGARSSLVVDCAMVERQVFQSWIALSRAETIHSKKPGSEGESIDEFKKALTACKGSIAIIATEDGLSDDIKTLIASVGDAFEVYAAESGKMAAGLGSGDYAESSGLIANLKYKALTSEIAKLFTKINHSSIEGVKASSAAAAAARRMLILISVAIILVSAAFAALMIRSITAPLSGLVGAVAKISGGDLTVAVKNTGNDEFGRIGASVNGLAADLRGLVSIVKQRLSVLDESGRNLAANMEETGAAVIQINANIESSRGQLEGQSSAVKEVIAAIEDLTLSVDKLSDRIQGQSASVSQSSSSVEEMIANIESVAANAEAAARSAEALSSQGGDGKAKIDEVNEAIESIMRYSDNLNEAAGLITEIADRTNLLAMNAAIEAAHAGEAGRGFAVVADEIRRLAEQSNERSKEISSDLGRVGSSIESVRAATGAVIESFGGILYGSSELGSSVTRIGEAMREQRIGGAQVLESLAALVDATRGIAADAARLKSGNAAILGRVESLDSMNRLVVQSSDEIRQGTREINEAIAGTEDLTAQTTSLIGEVMAATDKFTV